MLFSVRSRDAVTPQLKGKYPAVTDGRGNHGENYGPLISWKDIAEPYWKINDQEFVDVVDVAIFEKSGQNYTLMIVAVCTPSPEDASVFPFQQGQKSRAHSRTCNPRHHLKETYLSTESTSGWRIVSLRQQIHSNGW